jgi:hypothetical protein
MGSQRTLWQRYKQLGFWSKLSVWGSLASIIALLLFFFVPQPRPLATIQSNSVASSPGTTVLQSGRDIVINTPSISTTTTSNNKPKQEGSTVHQSKAPRAKEGPTQTMINSPGGIQAGGDVTVNSDRRLINSIVLQVLIETQTIVSTVTDVKVSAGLGSALALFTADKTRFRFVTDFMIRDQQLTPTLRRLTFVYTPETPTELLGKPIELLASINLLVMDYAKIFSIKHFDTTLGDTILNCYVIINGVSVATVSAGVQPTGALGAGQTNLNVGEVFSKIPDVYAAEVSR